MSHAEKAVNYHKDYNCAQAVLAAYAKDFGLDIDKALQVSVGFGGGIAHLQETCGAVSSSVAVLGLKSGYKEGDGRPKIDAVYDKVRSFTDEFKKVYGTIKCRDLLGCDLVSEEGHKFFVDNNLRVVKCREYIKTCCGLLDKYLAE